MTYAGTRRIIDVDSHLIENAWERHHQYSCRQADQRIA